MYGNMYLFSTLFLIKKCKLRLSFSYLFLDFHLIMLIRINTIPISPYGPIIAPNILKGIVFIRLI